MNRLNEEINAHPDDPELVWKLGQTAWEGGSSCSRAGASRRRSPLTPIIHQARASLAALRAAEPDVTRSPGRSTIFLPSAGSLFTFFRLSSLIGP